MNRLLSSKSLWTLVALVAFSVFAVNYAVSNPTGITGVSKTGCVQGGCHHASTASSATKVTISCTATSFTPGTQYTFRITIHHPTAKMGGCDISVDNGTLAVSGTGSGLYLTRRELTHNTPRVFTGDSVVWTFKWTAPATVGVYHIYAAGNAVNGNGTDDPADQWNITSFAITVGASGPQPKIALSVPSAIKTRVGTPTTTHVTLRNTGEAALTIDHYALRYGTAFTLTDTSVHTVAAHDSAVLTVTFSPSKHQPYIDSLIVYSNDLSSLRTSAFLSGSGTAGVLRVTPAPFDFGQVKLGDTKTLRMVIRNSGDDGLTIETLNADASTQFTVQSIVPMLTLPATLAPNDSIAITIAFQPTLVQPNTMAVHLSFSDIGASRDTSFTISGEGVPPGSVADPAPVVLQVYPNPATSEIRVNGDRTFGTYSIVNTNGEVVHTAAVLDDPSFSIDVSALAPGRYWLKMTDDAGHTHVTSFVVQR